MGHSWHSLTTWIQHRQHCPNDLYDRWRKHNELPIFGKKTLSSLLKGRNGFYHILSVWISNKQFITKFRSILFLTFCHIFPGEDAIHLLDLHPRSARRRPSRLWRRPVWGPAAHGTGSTLGAAGLVDDSLGISHDFTMMGIFNGLV